MSQPPEQPYGQVPPPPPGYGQVPPPAPQQPYQQPPGQYFGGQGPSGMAPSEERMWGMLAHLSWIAGSVIAIAPLGPLVIFLIFKERSPFVRRHAVEALNFWITSYILLAISVALFFILVGFFTFAIVAVASFVLSIIAAMAANRGENYRYPLTLRLVS